MIYANFYAFLRMKNERKMGFLLKWRECSYILLIETTRPMLDDSHVPHPFETVSIE